MWKECIQKDGSEVDKQAALNRENAVKSSIAFPNVDDVCVDKFLDTFFPEVLTE